jgi:hypothetical protein
MKKIAFALLFSSLIINSCKENKIQDLKSRLRLINASSQNGDINMDVEYQTIYATGVQYLNYSLFREYLAGKRKVQIKNQSNSVIIDTSITMEANKVYSIFIYDSMNSTKYKVVNEDLVTPVGSQCKIRFLHLSNDATNVMIYKDTNSVPIFTNYKNGDLSSYLQFNSGVHSFRVNGFNINYSQPEYILKPGYFYTMYLKGNTLSSNIDSLGIYTIEQNGNY